MATPTTLARGHTHVMATRQTLDIMEIRYGEGFCAQAQVAEFGVPVDVNDVGVTFHPAGHVLGSAQIALDFGGLRIVASGDYKRGTDPTCDDFEPVPCEVFITEATFGLPVFRHPPPQDEIAKLLASLTAQPDRAHLVGAYALGKAQRVIRLLRDAGYDRPIYIHGAMRRLCDYYQSQGIDLGVLEDATLPKGKTGDFAGEVIVGPPSAFGAKWRAAVRGPADQFRERLDAGPRPDPSARCRTATCDLGPL